MTQLAKEVYFNIFRKNLEVLIGLVGGGEGVEQIRAGTKSAVTLE